MSSDTKESYVTTPFRLINLILIITSLRDLRNAPYDWSVMVYFRVWLPLVLRWSVMINLRVWLPLVL